MAEITSTQKLNLANTPKGQLDHLLGLMHKADIPRLQQLKLRDFIETLPEIAIRVFGTGANGQKEDNWKVFSEQDLTTSRDMAVKYLRSSGQEPMVHMVRRIISAAYSNNENYEWIIINEKTTNYVKYVVRTAKKEFPEHFNAYEDMSGILAMKANLINLENVISKENLSIINEPLDRAIGALRKGYVMIGAVQESPIVYCMESKPVPLRV